MYGRGRATVQHNENVGKTFHRQTHVLPTLAVMIMVVVVVVMTMTVMRVVIGKK